MDDQLARIFTDLVGRLTGPLTLRLYLQPGMATLFAIRDGVKEIPIEERAQEEVTVMSGRTADGSIVPVTITPEGSKAANFGFDVTPARLVTGLVTERGVCAASEAGLTKLYPEFA